MLREWLKSAFSILMQRTFNNLLNIMAVMKHNPKKRIQDATVR